MNSQENDQRRLFPARAFEPLVGQTFDGRPCERSVLGTKADDPTSPDTQADQLPLWKDTANEAGNPLQPEEDKGAAINFRCLAAKVDVCAQDTSPKPEDIDAAVGHRCSVTKVDVYARTLEQGQLLKDSRMLDDQRLEGSRTLEQGQLLEDSRTLEQEQLLADADDDATVDYRCSAAKVDVCARMLEQGQMLKEEAGRKSRKKARRPRKRGLFTRGTCRYENDRPESVEVQYENEKPKRAKAHLGWRVPEWKSQKSVGGGEMLETEENAHDDA